MRRSTLLLVRGFVSIAAAILAFTWPGLTIAALIGLFVGYALLDGITTLWFGLASLAVTPMPMRQRASALTIRGVLGITVAIFAFVWPALTTFMVLRVVAVWAVLTG